MVVSNVIGIRGHRVVNNLAQNKSSGSNGSRVTFISFFFALIKGDIIRLIFYIFNGRDSLKHINATFLTLIPKSSGATQIQDYRRISRVNIIYKLISVLIANHLAESGPELHSLNQNTYTKGRLILDNIRLVEELLKRLNQRSTSRHVFVSLDISKAFYSASWKSIHLTLE